MIFGCVIFWVLSKEQKKEKEKTISNQTDQHFILPGLLLYLHQSLSPALDASAFSNVPEIFRGPSGRKNFWDLKNHYNCFKSKISPLFCLISLSRAILSRFRPFWDTFGQQKATFRNKLTKKLKNSSLKSFLMS